jgi:hypothetical protein
MIAHLNAATPRPDWRAGFSSRYLMSEEITADAIMQLGFGYWGSRTLLSAVEV